MSKQVSSQFTNGMKQWIQMDMKMSEHFKSIREIREKKKAVEVQLVNYMASNELTNTSIKLLNQKVSYSQETSYSSLSFKFLDSVLLEYFKNDQDKVDEIILFIRDRRSKKMSTGLKRKVPKD